MNELARKQVGRQTDRQTGSVYWRPLTSRKASLSLSLFLSACVFLFFPVHCSRAAEVEKRRPSRRPPSPSPPPPSKLSPLEQQQQQQKRNREIIISHFIFSSTVQQQHKSNILALSFSHFFSLLNQRRSQRTTERYERTNKPKKPKRSLLVLDRSLYSTSRI